MKYDLTYFKEKEYLKEIRDLKKDKDKYKKAYHKKDHGILTKHLEIKLKDEKYR